MGNLAYCGLYCDACSFRLAALERDRWHLGNLPDNYADAKAAPIEQMDLCPGCKLDPNPGNCPISGCARGRGYSTCAECDEMPCKELAEFQADGVPHHDTLQSLLRIREVGEEAWVSEQCVDS